MQEAALNLEEAALNLAAVQDAALNLEDVAEAMRRATVDSAPASGRGASDSVARALALLRRASERAGGQATAAGALLMGFGAHLETGARLASPSDLSSRLI